MGHSENSQGRERPTRVLSARRDPSVPSWSTSPEDVRKSRELHSLRGGEPSQHQMTHGERQLEPGQVIAERYRIEAPIGRGAMGAVWRAVHLQLESPVAIKFLNPAIANEPVML